MDIPVIRIDGIAPQNKGAIREALEAVPEHIMLFQTTSCLSQKLFRLEDIKPGEALAFTDGSGKYYGKIGKSPDGQKLLLDGKEL